MEARDNPVFGRKVFFLNPPYQIEKFVISRLREDEFEIYVISDYKDAKNVLRHYPDSICFICIDSGLTIEEWLNFVVTLEREEALSSIFLGIISKNMKSADKTHFMLHTNVPAGFLTFNGNVTELTATVTEILNLNGAKGRRQSVRTSCEHDATAAITLPTPMGDRAFHMIDISSVGIAARAPLPYARVFKPNTLFRNAPIHFGTNHVQGTLVLYAIKTGEKYISLIFLFTAGTPNSVKSIIRGYVAENLQYEMRMAIQNDPKDETDYSRSFEFDQNAFLVEDKDI